MAMMSHSGSSGDRLLAALRLFTIEQPEWTVEAAAAALGVSATTAYRYFGSLTKTGLISPVSRASYTLGPAIIQMDRQIQIADPMLRAARGVMTDLVAEAADGSIALLCRLFHDRVMCVHQVMGSGPQAPVSYERGRPMPLFRGATSKILLAHVSIERLGELVASDREALLEAGLPATVGELHAALAPLRVQGYAVTRGEVDRGVVGMAVPLQDGPRILGSLSVVLSGRTCTPAVERRTLSSLARCARRIEVRMETARQAVRPRRRSA